MVHTTLQNITQRIRKRSQPLRRKYLARMCQAKTERPARMALSCSNLAHGFAACPSGDKESLKGDEKPNIAIVSAYNDMLSAHQPYERFPAIIKEAAHRRNAVAQFAGGVPAMCDGITQGQAGMELSLFSRDVIAMATAVSLSHNMFDGVLCLGICDKIVPGLLIGSLSFGHLPVVFVPSGPMPSGFSNKEKNAIRQKFAEGKIGKEVLLEAESGAYHSAGTCNFYGTANSNQMLMEIMGLQLPGSAFVPPNTALRDALTQEATYRVIKNTARAGNMCSLSDIVDERVIVNGIVGLLATGGSTNHTIHLIAIAKAAGIIIDWQDFADLSQVVPLLARIYPNGEKDVNHFHEAGGMAYLIHTLLEAGLLHADVETIIGTGLEAYTTHPVLEDKVVIWQEGVKQSNDISVLTSVESPFNAQGGLTLLQGNLGRAVIKTSAVKQEHLVIEAPAKIFTSQQALIDAFQRKELHADFVAVVLFQGPRANGMPELHRLTPTLGVLQDLGFKVALVTDGRMSGASGKVPAAIHVTSESVEGGNLAKLRDGDMVCLDAVKGRLDVQLSDTVLNERECMVADLSANQHGVGRELFETMRRHVSGAEQGASFIVSSGQGE